MKLGFIGLGIMGKPMAKNLLNAGYQVYIYNRSQKAIEEVAQCGGSPCASPKEIAQKSDIIFTMLPNSPEVKEVLMGKNGILEGLQEGAILVDMSSIDPTVSIELEKEVTGIGGEMIDAPVSGGEPKAISGTLSFMCGGKEEIFEKVKPILKSMGASVVRVGEIGSGNMTKLANQIIVATNIAGLSEAFVLAAKSGVDPEAVFYAIRGGLAGSTVMNDKAPMMLKGNFKPGFRIDLHVKDLNNALMAADNVEMDLPLTELVIKMMKQLQKEGKGNCDHSSVVEYYEEKNDIRIMK